MDTTRSEKKNMELKGFRDLIGSRGLGVWGLGWGQIKASGDNDQYLKLALGPFGLCRERRHGEQKQQETTVKAPHGKLKWKTARKVWMSWIERFVSLAVQGTSHVQSLPSRNRRKLSAPSVSLRPWRINAGFTSLSCSDSASRRARDGRRE